MQIEYYIAPDGTCPYAEWLATLSTTYQTRVLKRVNRIFDGLLGDWKRLSNTELCEMRLNFGKGYRIYFKILGNTVVLIVAGSDKSSQKTIIAKANKYLDEYLKRSTLK